MLSTTLVLLNALLRNKKYRPLLLVIKGFRNGAVYGAKVRFPHAFVNSFLFKTATFQEHVRAIIKATYTHSRNLASYVAIYKIISIFLQRFNILQNSKYGVNHFLAAVIGGFCVFGQENKINEQINLYLLSRVIYGLVKLLANKGYIYSPSRKTSFSMFGCLVWGLAVWLFEMNQGSERVLQPSLQSSMTYLYHDSNLWSNVDDFLFKNRP
ncbi:hypothetical protein HELRODRAFT_71941 [Helobdella robusta]|uniref:Peroxisomal membrane protein 4 n=1 Tax=Helobdella robusta TaxID=6412 RepID=T1G0T1_HELRO|nr:hypothetical protein HELRODRAFT_71941 [Helobdella robusta]ESO10930.1 hypothetical protein HELRODRAFT_71941 [Helobdella robusta]